MYCPLLVVQLSMDRDHIKSLCALHILTMMKNPRKSESTSHKIPLYFFHLSFACEGMRLSELSFLYRHGGPCGNLLLKCTM